MGPAPSNTLVPFGTPDHLNKTVEQESETKQTKFQPAERKFSNESGRHGKQKESNDKLLKVCVVSGEKAAGRSVASLLMQVTIVLSRKPLVA